MEPQFLKSEEQEIEKSCNNSVNSPLNEALMKMNVLENLSYFWWASTTMQA